MKNVSMDILDIKVELKNLYYKTTFTECINIFKYNNIRPTEDMFNTFISTSKREECEYCEVVLRLDYNLLLKNNKIMNHVYFYGSKPTTDYRIVTDNRGLLNVNLYINKIIVNFKPNCKNHSSVESSCLKCKYNQIRIDDFLKELSKYTDILPKFY